MPTLKLTATLKDTEGNPLSGKTIEFYKSSDGINFSLITTKTTNAEGVAEATDEITAYGTYYYKARFPGDDQYEASEAVASYTYSFDLSQIMQMIMNWLPWIIVLMLIALMVSLAASEEE